LGELRLQNDKLYEIVQLSIYSVLPWLMQQSKFERVHSVAKFTLFAGATPFVLLSVDVKDNAFLASK